MNRRPAGVSACAVVLALAALGALSLALLSTVAAIIAPHLPNTAAQPGAAPPPPGLVLGIMVFSVLFYLAIAAWAGASVVGLFRMRPWARISTIVIGACLILAGLLGALGMVATQFAVSNMPLPPNADPRALRIVFGVMGVFSLAIAGVGVWWIIYLLLRRTRDAFKLANAEQKAIMPDVTGNYSVPELDPTTPHNLYSPDPPNSSTAASAASPRRPASITVIAVLLLICSFTALLQMLSPFPLFLFGLILTGWPAHVTMLLWCAVNGVAGVGLLKLERPAWIIACGIFCIPVINALAMIAPGSRARFHEYMQSVMERSSFGIAQPAFSPQMMGAFAVMGILIALIFSGVVLTLLRRAKWAFEPQPHDQAAA